MGTMMGHVLNGLGIMLVGLWHLHNVTKTYAQRRPHKFRARPWYPAEQPLPRYTEPALIVCMAAASAVIDTVVSPRRHTPWDADGSIPLSHMNALEHALIALFFAVFAATAVAADALNGPVAAPYAAAVAAFGEEALMFWLHSATDRAGPEGRYHMLMLAAAASCGALTLAEAARPRSVVVALCRAAALALQGAWLVHMGFALWLPSFAPAGCAVAGSPPVLRCGSADATKRALGLANLRFSLDALLVMGLAFGLLFFRCRRRRPSYGAVGIDHESDSDDVALAHSELALPGSPLPSC